MLCHLFNPISWGAQTITPLTFHSSSIPETLCPKPVVYKYISCGPLFGFRCRSANQTFQFRRWMPHFRGNDKKRLKRSFTTGIRCCSYFSPAWLTAHRAKALFWFLSFSTHIYLWQRGLLIKPACSEKDCECGWTAARVCFLVKQLSVIILEVSASQFLESSLVFFVSVLISTAVKELLRRTFTSAGCCLQVVFLLVPPVRWASG